MHYTKCICSLPTAILRHKVRGARMCAVAYLEMRACVTSDPDRQYQYKDQLIAEVDRIAEKMRWVKRNRGGELVPDYIGLADAAGLSRGGLNGIIGGSEPQPRTLIRLARYAGESPVRLYRSAGWLTDDDLGEYVNTATERRDSATPSRRRLVDDAFAAGEVTEEEVLTALQVSQRLYQRLADRVRGQAPAQPFRSSEQPESEERG